MNLLLLSEVADELRVSVRTVEREIALGKIAVVMVSSRRRVARAELDRYIAAHQEIQCRSEKSVSDGKLESLRATVNALSARFREEPPEPTRKRSKLWSAASRSTLRLVGGKNT